MDVVTPEVDGGRTERRPVAPLGAMLPLVLQRASPQAAGVVEAVLAVDQPNVVDFEEAYVVVGLV